MEPERKKHIFGRKSDPVSPISGDEFGALGRGPKKVPWRPSQGEVDLFRWGARRFFRVPLSRGFCKGT